MWVRSAFNQKFASPRLSYGLIQIARKPNEFSVAPAVLKILSLERFMKIAKHQTESAFGYDIHAYLVKDPMAQDTMIGWWRLPQPSLAPNALLQRALAALTDNGDRQGCGAHSLAHAWEDTTLPATWTAAAWSAKQALRFFSAHSSPRTKRIIPSFAEESWEKKIRYSKPL